MRSGYAKKSKLLFLYCAVLLSILPGIGFSQADIPSTEPAFDTIVMPVPVWKPPKNIPEPGQHIMIHDIATKSTQKFNYSGFSNDPRTKTSDFTPGKMGCDTISFDETFSDNFTNLELVQNPEAYPWSVNCKLYMHWGNTVAEGSGVLIDSKHVLTAGHCVYYHDWGGWADWIEVVPAFSNGYKPYGNAVSINISTWANWVNNQDYDYDLGIIQLDRPVGALTGWHGYGYNSDDNFFWNNYFHNPGYPAEEPFNGLYQYYWYGSYDNILTEQLDHVNYSYGGQSGSGAYFSNAGSRIVYGALSHFHLIFPLLTTSHIRITSIKYGGIGNFISLNTPSAYTPVPLWVALAPSTLEQGAKFSSFTYYLHNYSSASFSGINTVSVYLSADQTITSSDLLIGSHNVNINLGPKSTTLVNCIGNSLPSIPCTVSPGNYFVGVRVGNNYATGQDAEPVTIISHTPPAMPGAITGLDPVCENTSQQYSISPVANAISYNWTLPAGWTGTSSNTSINAITGDNGGNITVSANKPCSTGPYQIKGVSVNNIPEQPFQIYGNIEVCPGVSNNYYINPVYGATAYTWTLPVGWSGSSTSYFIDVIPGTTGGTISVTASNTCGTSPSQSMIISVKPELQQPAVITGSAQVCPSTLQTYSVIADPDAEYYIWSLPAGWSGASSTNVIQVITGSSGGNISVIAHNDCGDSPSQTKSITLLTTLPTPSAISGPATVCWNSTNIYSTSPVSGATSYTWSLPSGWTGNSTTTSIAATAGQSGGNISVVANNDCGISPGQSKSVIVNNIPATPGSIAGPVSVCWNTTNTYSIFSVNGATSYTWTLPSGWSGNSASTSIQATAGGAGGAITVKANNSCGSSPPQTKSVVAGTSPAMPGAITGITSLCQGTSASYSILPVAGASTYSWNLPSGWNGTSTSTTLNTIAGLNSGSLSVSAGNSCGFGPAVSTGVTVTPYPASWLFTGNSIGSGQTMCKNASETITIAGNNGYFQGQSGSETSLTAGQWIRFLPGASFFTGAHLQARIGSQCIPCSANKIAGAILSNEESVLQTANTSAADNSLFIVYPNPSFGDFTIELKDGLFAKSAVIKVLNLTGSEILNDQISDKKKMTFSISAFPSGIYIVMVISGNLSGIKKVILNK